MNTRIICGFPGVGKSYIFNNKDRGFTCLDSDSSTFPKENFPKNYIEHIKEKMGTVDVIFVSTHKAVREALDDEGLFYYIARPMGSSNTKSMYLERYKKRGSPQAFIDLMDKMWNTWFEEVCSYAINRTIRLKSGEYLDTAYNEFFKSEVEPSNIVRIRVGEEFTDLYNKAIKYDNCIMEFNGERIEYCKGMTEENCWNDYKNRW